MPETLPISVYIVSGPEAHRIRGVLESVHGWAAEIVVVINNEVADGTDAIAEEFGAVVHREPWKGFIGQKDSALKKTSQPWTLNLDADEVVPAPLRDEISRAIASSPDDAGAYSFPRCTEFLGRWIRHGDWYPDRVIRLARRERAHWAGVEPHAVLRTSGRILRLDSDLLHFSNETIDRQIAKIGPYSGAFAAAASEAGRHARWTDLAVRPLWRFVRGYFLRLGFLDGIPGYYIAWSSAFQVATRYTKLWNLGSTRDSERDPAEAIDKP